jgi:hypothetical protein
MNWLMKPLAAVLAGIRQVFCWLWRVRWRLIGVAVAIVLIVVGYFIYDRTRDEPETFFNDPVKQFKYGSTGGDRLGGIPVGIFKALPELCRKYFPGEGWQSLGFIYEEGMDRPVGTSKRRTLGLDRIGLNCATCHVGTYRVTAASKPVVVEGMPAGRIDLGRFARAVIACSLDENFNPWQVRQAAERANGKRYSFVDRRLIEAAAVTMREVFVLLRYRFRFLDHEIEPGPGRFDTFNSAKALLDWPFDDLPAREATGIVDFPSLWLQGPRAAADMHLHWDGNNDSVDERNRSAAFGSGAMPVTLDRASMRFIAEWLKSEANHPPKYAERVEKIDDALATHGKPLYDQYCASCHGASGTDFSGAAVGHVDDIAHIRTDPCRLDNYTYALAVDQDNLYAGYPNERFRHFRKTHGYANMPLDGLWLRGPYLHNGSVPTVRDLLEPAANRPKAFFRGYDLIDRKKLGFVSDVPEANGIRFFKYETQCVGDADFCKRRANAENRHDDNKCVPGPWAGNSNRGHEGREYGTELSAEDKDALVEFLKTF